MNRSAEKTRRSRDRLVPIKIPGYLRKTTAKFLYFAPNYNHPRWSESGESGAVVELHWGFHLLRQFMAKAIGCTFQGAPLLNCSVAPFSRAVFFPGIPRGCLWIGHKCLCSTKDDLLNYTDQIDSLKRT